MPATNPWLQAYVASPTFGKAPVRPQAQAPAAYHASTGVGSLLGGILGSIGGGAIAGAGTFGLGAVPGAIAGGGAGSALGDALEQYLTHADHHVDLGNVGREGALGLAGGAVGEVAKGGLMGLRLARGINIGAKGADAVLPAASKLESALAAAPSKMSTAGKVDATANKLLASQYGTIGKPVARSTQLNDTVGKLANFGITKPVDAERIANGITGANGILTKAVTDAAGSAGRVPTDGLMQIVDDALQNHGVVDTGAKSVKAIVKAKLAQLAGGAKTTVNGDAHPSDALGVMKDLEKKIADLSGKGDNYKLTDPGRLDQASVLRSLHNEIEDRLYTVAGGNKNVSKVLTPEVRQSLVNLHPGNSQWAKYVDGTIMKSKDIGAVRSIQAPFVKINKVINEAALNDNTAGGQIAAAAKAGRGIVANVRDAALNSDTAKRAAAGALKGASGFIQKTGKVAGATASQLAPRAVYTAATSPAQPVQASPVDLSAQDTQVADPTATGTQDSSSSQDNSGAFSPETLQALAIHDIQATGGKNLAKIAQLQALFGSKAAKPLSSATNQQIANAQSGLQQLGVLTQELGANPNAANANAVASILPGSLGNAARGAAGTQGFNTARNEIVDVLARLRTGAAITAAEEEQYKSMLPTAGDSPATVTHKVNIYKQLFQGILQRAQSGDTTDPTAAQLN